MRIALLNVKYSPNLGDGLLSECLEYGLAQAIPGLRISALDLGGRRDYVVGSTRRGAALAALQSLPRAWRHRIARTVLGRMLRGITPFWRAELAGAEAAILGGGNLLADADLNFPLKVAAAFALVAQAGLPVAVQAVGVSDNWSSEGADLFGEAFSNARLVHASVRDERSRAIWVRRLGPLGVAAPSIARDPGLLASECYGVAARPFGQGRRIGLGLTNPVALRYHADETIADTATTTRWLAELVRGFTARGDTVLLFTNGSPEDEAYLARAAPALLASADPAGSVAVVARLSRPAALAGFISTLDLLAAHRLHACIAAYSYGVPHLGFTWDAKLLGFFEAVGRGRFLRGAVSTSVTDLLALAEEAMVIGIDPGERQSVLAEARADITDLAGALLAAVTPAPAIAPMRAALA